MNGKHHSPTILHLHDLVETRAALSPADFRAQLRRYLLDHPQVTLRRVAAVLGVTRQCVGALVGPLDRGNPKREKAEVAMAELRERVAGGESASAVVKDLGISMSSAAALGFRAKEIRPPHGTWDRARKGCNCWRCRIVAGVAVPRGPRMTTEQKWACLDWLAWVNPDSGRGLTQTAVAKLVGVGQMAVSRISRAAGGAE
jgi:predicted transcriptional regulator